MDVSMIKNELRCEYLAKRKAIPAEVRADKDRALCRLLSESDLFLNAKEILAYAPKSPEIDILPLVQKAIELGKRVAFPRCAQDFSLSFHYAHPSQLVRGHFGIMEPSDNLPLCQASEDSICLVPALLFDFEGYRIGYGKGYYDRFLSSYRGLAVGIARDAFILPKLPRGAFDLRVKVLASETEVKALS